MAVPLLLYSWQFCYTNSFSGPSFYTVDYWGIPKSYLGCSHSFKLPTEKFFVLQSFSFSLVGWISSVNDLVLLFRWGRSAVSAFPVITPGWIRVQWVLQIWVTHRAHILSLQFSTQNNCQKFLVSWAVLQITHFCWVFFCRCFPCLIIGGNFWAID